MEFQKFKSQFNFRPEKSLFVGIERESFLTEKDSGKIVPLAPKVLELINQNGSNRFGFELSACQLEDRVGPCDLSKLKKELLRNEKIIKKAETEIGFKRLNDVEIAPNDMPLDVYPDPTGRYQKIVKNMSKEILLAACQIIGTHIHIGMPDHESAIKIYNKVIKEHDRLHQLGDGSSGERLEAYKIVAPDRSPEPYRSWEEFYEYAISKSFVSDPRSCWHLIRISVHGTIEFRMFGSTSDLDTVIFWAEECRNLCERAM